MKVIEFTSTNFFPVCHEKTVLEIGPLDGRFSTEILKHHPKSLTLLEASHTAIELLKSFSYQDSVKIIHGDMHRDLPLIGRVDVVIMLGIIYHSHAPLYVLEEVVNVCDPDIIIIDNPGNYFNCIAEKVNVIGMRATTDNRKTSNLVITIDREILVSALTNLGYKLDIELTYPVDDTFKNGNIPLYQFKKL